MHRVHEAHHPSIAVAVLRWRYKYTPDLRPSPVPFPADEPSPMAAPPTASYAASPLLHRPHLRLRRSLRPPLRLPPTSSCTSSSRRPSVFQKSQFRCIASRPARRCVPIQIATAFDEDQGDFSLVHDDGDEAFGENDAPPIRPRLLLPTLRCRLLLPTPPPTPGYALRHSSPAPPIRPRLLLPTPPPPPDTVLPGEPLRRSSSPPSSHCRSPCCTVLPSRSRSRTPGGGTRCPRSPDPRTTAPKATICEDLKLERVLQKASMGDNTVILTTLNAAWASPGSVLNLFMDSFRSGVRTSSLLKHLVIIAFDWTAYKQCVKIHPYCFALGTEGVDFSEEKRFLTSGYLEMMWKRLDFLRLVLEKGYSFVFSCPNGHTICSNCKHRVENHCPNCRQELGNIRCLALEKVAESLQLPCKFQSLGCTEIHPYQNKLKHEDLCRFRPYNCPYAGSECLITGDVPDQ